MKAKTGTYLVEFIDGTAVITGNNYKPWWQHMVDFFYREYRDKNRTSGKSYIHSRVADIVKSVKYSAVPYVDDGGLKWAGLEAYQEIIDEEGARLHQAFTPLKDIKFEPSYSDKAKLKKKFEKI